MIVQVHCAVHSQAEEAAHRLQAGGDGRERDEGVVARSSERRAAGWVPPAQPPRAATSLGATSAHRATLGTTPSGSPSSSAAQQPPCSPREQATQQLGAGLQRRSEEVAVPCLVLARVEGLGGGAVKQRSGRSREKEAGRRKGDEVPIICPRASCGPAAGPTPTWHQLSNSSNMGYSWQSGLRWRWLQQGMGGRKHALGA